MHVTPTWGSVDNFYPTFAVQIWALDRHTPDCRQSSSGAIHLEANLHKVLALLCVLASMLPESALLCTKYDGWYLTLITQRFSTMPMLGRHKLGDTPRILSQTDHGRNSTSVPFRPTQRRWYYPTYYGSQFRRSVTAVTGAWLDLTPRSSQFPRMERCEVLRIAGSV